MPTTGLYKTLLPCFIEIPVFNGNSVDHDQTPHSASDLGLGCFAVCQCPFSGTPCCSVYKCASSAYLNTNKFYGAKRLGCGCWGRGAGVKMTRGRNDQTSRGGSGLGAKRLGSGPRGQFPTMVFGIIAQ